LPLSVVFVVTLAVLFVAAAFLISGVTELLGVDADDVVLPWLPLGFR
jgi:cation transporter-like permease